MRFQNYPQKKNQLLSEQSFPNSIKDSLLTPDQTSLQRKVAQPEDSLTSEEFEQFRYHATKSNKNKMHMMVTVVVVYTRHG